MPCSREELLADEMGMGGPDYILDIGGTHRPAGLPLSPGNVGDIDAADPGAGAGGKSSRRPWLAVRWRCCAVYSRIYRDPAATAYHGQCPTCGRAITIAVGPGGTDCRFFDAQ